MNKKYLVFGIALIALLTVGLASAYGGLGPMNGEHHEDVESILETGTYADLEAYRNEVGYPVMHRVQSREDFELMQERHQWMEENGYEPGEFRGTGEGPWAGQGKGQGLGNGQGRGMHSGQGFKGQGAGFGGCPMLQ
ncbi:hypothetical protein K9L97_01405 [Candidatus Woesearchaeota archaeon]|nr:hypothetical protein [Candidatus Woesearchaeota archaeon]